MTKAFVFALAMLPGAAWAQACDLPAGWSNPRPARAATSGAMRYALAPGTAVTLALAPSAKVKFAVKPGRKVSKQSFGGLAALDIVTAGTVSVSLSNRAYVDLVRDGKALASTGHRDGCGGVRKSVDFAVVPGRYLIQIADAPEARVRMLVTP